MYIFLLFRRDPLPHVLLEQATSTQEVQTVHVQILKGIYVSSFSINSIHVIHAIQ